MMNEAVGMLQEWLDSNEWGDYDSENEVGYCHFCRASQRNSPITELQHEENCLVIRARKYIKKENDFYNE